MMTQIASVLMSTAIDFTYDFTYGEPCNRLEDVSEETMPLVLSPVYSSDYGHFCAVEEAEDCADFTLYVEEYGHLVASWDEGFCRFLPARVIQTM